MKTAEINAGYGRTPRIRGYTKVCRKLRTTGGWRLRSVLGTKQDSAQTNVGAMLSHIDKGEWENALICLEDLREDVEVMFRAVREAKS
jgi:hypothetical protein